MILQQLKAKLETREKTCFYCSDGGKADIDIYFSLVHEPMTNPMEWYNFARLGAGKGVEEEMLKVLKDNGVVAEDYDQNVHGNVTMMREGVEVHGRIDAISKENTLEVEAGCPIEIKSINNANKFDIARYVNLNPRENYVKQLAMYMDFMGKDTGYLFVISVDGLNRFWFTCKKIGEGIYKCENTTVNIKDEYIRFAKLLENVKTKTLPPITCRYKIPLEEIDFRKLAESGKLSKTAIAKARAGEKVIGDEDSWQILYSPWKDNIIKDIMKVEIGYNDKELATINEKTKGYSTWNYKLNAE